VLLLLLLEAIVSFAVLLMPVDYDDGGGGGVGVRMSSNVSAEEGTSSRSSSSSRRRRRRRRRMELGVELLQCAVELKRALLGALPVCVFDDFNGDGDDYGDGDANLDSGADAESSSAGGSGSGDGGDYSAVATATATTTTAAEVEPCSATDTGSSCGGSGGSVWRAGRALPQITRHSALRLSTRAQNPSGPTFLPRVGSCKQEGEATRLHGGILNRGSSSSSRRSSRHFW